MKYIWLNKPQTVVSSMQANERVLSRVSKDSANTHLHTLSFFSKFVSRATNYVCLFVCTRVHGWEAKGLPTLLLFSQMVAGVCCGPCNPSKWEADI